MAYFSMPSLLQLVFLLLVLHSCKATWDLPQTKCQVSSHLMAMEPNISTISEAGFSETWDYNSELFQCAGVEVTRYTIQPNGLLLPLYTNSDRFLYVIQGEAIFGLMVHGCSRESYGQRNECQIIRHKKGDVVAVRAGETNWGYNDGNEPLVVISVNRIIDTGDRRVFWLAGSEKILTGFSSEFISQAFNINDELALKLQSEDLRGRTVYPTGDRLQLNTQTCPRHDQQEPKDRLSNVVDESFCNINARITKISDASKADVFIPKVGYFKTVDAHQLPILKLIELGATYHLLRKNVMRLSHWENSYSIIYMIKGEGQIQVVDDNGKNVFDDVVKGGQLLIVPKNFVMAKLAKSKIFEYIIFKTNSSPITSDLSGQNSVIYRLPSEVVTNAYNITEEEAKRVKFGRKEISLAKVMTKYT